MILPTNGATLSGTAEMQNFGIEMNESMFNMLTKNVYSDTVLAVMREWSTNAVDACLEAKLPIRYKVTLPTLLVPEFSVRDYGTGLTPDDVTGLFSMLGASTKRNSNKFNGTFGIGRMSGLAYTDSFMIESYLNGIKYSFAVSTDSGIPQMISLGDTPTAEDNGLKLTIVTKQKDLNVFSKKAGYLYQYFTDKPECEQEINYPTCEKILTGSDWYIEGTDYGHRYHGDLLIIMGNVAYNVATHELNTNKGVSDMLSTSIRLKAELGAVSITPGRESLSMDEKTINYIVQRLLKLKKEATAEFYKKLGDLPEGWQRALAFNNAIRELPTAITKTIDIKLTGIEKKYFEIYKSWNSKEIALIDQPKYPELDFYIYSRGRVTGSNFLSYKGGHLTISDRVHFMIADNRIGIKDTVAIYRSAEKEAYQKANPSSVHYRGEPTIIVLKAERWDKNNINTFIAKAQEYLTALGNPTYFKASDYHSPVAASSGANTVRTATEFYPLNFSIGYNSINVIVTRASSPIKATNDTTFYYIEMSSYDIMGFGEEKLSVYIRFLKLYYKQNPNSTKKLEIIGVPKNGMRNIATDPRFIPIEGSLQDLVKDVSIIDTHKTTEYFNKTNTSSYFLRNAIKCDYPLDLLSYFIALHDFEKKFPYGDVEIPTEGISDIFKCTTKYPATKWTFTDFRDNYPLLIPAIRRLGDSESLLTRYAQLEHTVRQHNLNIFTKKDNNGN